jgi:hypothetical protein
VKVPVTDRKIAITPQLIEKRKYNQLAIPAAASV